MTLTTSLINPGLCRITPFGNRRKAGTPLPGNNSCSNPPTGLDPDNPWDMISKGGQWETCLENNTLNGILGDPKYNPYETRHKMMQAILLMSYGFIYEALKKKIEEENKKAIKDTQNLTLAAR